MRGSDFFLVLECHLELGNSSLLSSLVFDYRQISLLILEKKLHHAHVSFLPVGIRLRHPTIIKFYGSSF